MVVDPHEHADGRAVRDVTWTAIWDPDRRGWGTELLHLSDRHAESSAVHFDADGVPYELSYEVDWDAVWRVREVTLRSLHAGVRRTLRLASDGRGDWHGDGDPADLAGCLEIDIWPTPFTNTFPIRRLGLAVGDRAEIRVVYIQAPELTVSAADQAYSRLGDDRYRFESLADGFAADLTVDRDGIVLDYPGLFRRLT